MKSILTLFILMLMLLICSCRSWEKYYFGEESIQKIKHIKHNKNYTFLNYRLNKPTRENIRKYAGQPINLTYRKRSFHQKKVVFALYGPSTANYAVLDRVENGKLLRLDSVYCDAHEFLFLQMGLIKKGDYQVKAWGCRYRQTFDIRIK